MTYTSALCVVCLAVWVRNTLTSQSWKMTRYYPAVMVHKSVASDLYCEIKSFEHQTNRIITCPSNHVSTLRISFAVPEGWLQSSTNFSLRNLLFPTFKCIINNNKQKTVDCWHWHAQNIQSFALILKETIFLLICSHDHPYLPEICAYPKACCIQVFHSV